MQNIEAGNFANVTKNEIYSYVTMITNRHNYDNRKNEIMKYDIMENADANVEIDIDTEDENAVNNNICRCYCCNARELSERTSESDWKAMLFQIIVGYWKIKAIRVFLHGLRQGNYTQNRRYINFLSNAEINMIRNGMPIFINYLHILAYLSTPIR
jgi:hypothetical protein